MDSPEPAIGTAVSAELPFDLIFDSLPAPALLQDEGFRLVAVNRAFERLSGYDRGSLVGRDAVFLHHPDHLSRLRTARERLSAGAAPEDGLAATRLVARDGQVHHVQLRTSRLERHGHFYLLCVVENVDQVHEREQRLVSRAEWFRILFEHSPMPVAVQDLQYRMVRVNTAFTQWCGYAASDLIGRDPLEFHPPELRAPLLARRLQRVNSGQRVAWSSEENEPYPEFIHRDGRRLSYRIHLQNLLGPDGRTYVVAVLMDMSREVASRSALERQAENFLRAFDRAPVGMFVQDARGAVLRSNDALNSLIGFSPAEIREGAFTRANTGSDDAWRPVDGAAADVERRRVRVRRKDGRMIWLEEIRRPVRNLDGEHVRLSVAQDVTREHELRAKLEDMVLQQSVLLRSMSAGLAHVVGELVVQINPVLPAMIGKAAGAIVGQPYESMFGTPEFWREVRIDSTDVLRAGGPYRVEVRLPVAESYERVFDLTLRRVDRHRAELGIIMTLADISELRSQADRLQRAIAELGAVLENEEVGIAYLGAGRIERANRRMAELAGIAYEALPGTEWSVLFPVQASAMRRVGEAGTDVLRASELHRLRRPDGTHRDCRVYLGPVDSRSPSSEIAVVIDKTDREAAEARAAATQARFDSFTALLTEAVFLVDLDAGRGVFANEHFETVLGAPVDRFAERPQVAWDCVVPACRSLVQEAIARASEGVGAAAIDIDIAHPGRGSRTLRVRMFLDRGEARELYVIAEDVSEYRALERQRLEEALQQRDLLVREVHHRIKNNLQGVAGLLQQIATRRPDVQEVLAEVASQIHAIAQVHGLQVKRGEFLQPERLLQAVCTGLRTMFGVRVAIAVDSAGTEAWGIPEQEAVPIALVVNELITNAIKHRNPRDSAVSAALQSAPDGTVLTVRNAGFLPLDFEFDRQQPAPSGLGLVKALLPRRGTRLELRSRDGVVETSLWLGEPALRRSAGP